MFYMLKRTWPSLLKTAMICGTICYGMTAWILAPAVPVSETPAPAEIVALRKSVNRLELAVTKMLEGTPAREIRRDLWEPDLPILPGNQAAANLR